MADTFESGVEKLNRGSMWSLVSAIVSKDQCMNVVYGRLKHHVARSSDLGWYLLDAFVAGSSARSKDLTGVRLATGFSVRLNSVIQATSV